MSLGRYKTAKQILDQVGTEVGLGTTADPFSSTNNVWRRLVALLTSAGQRLSAEYDFPGLIAEAVLTKAAGVWTLPTGWSDAGSDVLDLPADFDHMIPQTHWDRTNSFTVGGPLSPQMWQLRQAGTVGTIWAEFRMDSNQVRFLPVPLADRVLSLEYASRAWVRSAAVGLGNGNTLGAAAGGWDTPEAVGDWVILPPLVIEAALKLEWKKSTGQNTAQAQKDFDDLVSVYQAKTPRAILSLDGCGVPRPTNVPDTGYGS